MLGVTQTFDVRGIILIEWVPSGYTIDQYYYKAVSIKLIERARNKLPVLWKNTRVFHHASARNTISIRRETKRRYFNIQISFVVVTGTCSQ